jgi:hypothetical protein
MVDHSEASGSFLGVCYSSFEAALVATHFEYRGGATQRFFSDGGTEFRDGASVISGVWRLGWHGDLVLRWPHARRRFSLGWAQGSEGVTGIVFTDRSSGEATVGRFDWAVSRDLSGEGAARVKAWSHHLSSFGLIGPQRSLDEHSR